MLQVPAKWHLMPLDVQSSEHYVSVLFPASLRKKKKRCVPQEGSKQNVFHMLWEDLYVLMCLFVSKFTIFFLIAWIFVFNEADHILWLQVRVSATFLKLEIRDNLLETACVQQLSLLRPPFVKLLVFEIAFQISIYLMCWLSKLWWGKNMSLQ